MDTKVSFSTRTGHITRLSAIVAASLMLGACAGGTGLPTGDLFQMSQAEPSANPSATASVGEARTELERATAYWGQKYAEQPTSLEAALGFSKNLRALGDTRRAIAVLQQASVFHGENPELAGEYGRLALSLGQVEIASKILAAADDPAKPDWRVISARGAALAKQGKFAEAIPHFDRALTLANGHPSVLNNLALAHAMNGQPAQAETLLRQATATGAEAKKVRQNLALVLGLQGKYEEAQQVAAMDMPMEQAAQRIAQIQQMVKLDPIAPQSASSKAQALANAWSAGGQGLRSTNTAVAPTGQAVQAMASR